MNKKTIPERRHKPSNLESGKFEYKRDDYYKGVEKIKSLHSYDLPVIEVFDVEQINEEAKEWLKESLK